MAQRRDVLLNRGCFSLVLPSDYLSLLQIMNKFVATEEEMVDLLDTDLTQTNTEAIIESVGTVSKVARGQMSTQSKVYPCVQ